MTNVNDAHGREIERTYFGTDGKPVNVKEGYARITRHYDPHGAVVEMAYFGASGEPVLSDEDSLASKTSRTSLAERSSRRISGSEASR